MFSNNLVAKSGTKVAKKYYCENCDYTCCKKYNWDKHLSTSKHTEVTVSNISVTCKMATNYSCEHCDKKYESRNGLWRHKTKGNCVATLNDIIGQSIINIEETPVITHDKDDIIMMILKQNADLIKEQSNFIKEQSNLNKEQSNLNKEQSDIKQIILEIVKNGITNNSHNTINSHNKAFNLNFFLNETCKNAMNITEFVDSIKLELSDLMELGEIGYVAGMSKIITKNLNALDETIRPIHCTDTKRETFYVKDEDKWEKEDVETKKLKKLIFRLSNKTYKLMPKYREMYPDYDSSTSTHSDEYCKIIIEAMMCDPAKDDKIIRNISKITAIAGK